MVVLGLYFPLLLVVASAYSPAKQAADATLVLPHLRTDQEAVIGQQTVVTDAAADPTWGLEGDAAAKARKATRDFLRRKAVHVQEAAEGSLGTCDDGRDGNFPFKLVGCGCSIPTAWTLKAYVKHY